MQDDNRQKIAAADKGNRFADVTREAQAKRSQRLGKEAGVRPGVNLGRPATR